MTIAVLVGVAILAFWLIGIYNSLVSLKNRFENAFSQIDVQLKRRHDLIPNLVETAKGYLQHEKETLENVIKARNQAVAARESAEKGLNSKGAVAELAGAESMLQGALANFFSLTEAYPDLKADQTMKQLSEELSSTENRISFARQGFNDAVTAYNIAREKFPNIIVANNFGFLEGELWQLDPGSAAHEVPKVSFS